jgi:hypothetical protein
MQMLCPHLFYEADLCDCFRVIILEIYNAYANQITLLLGFAP